MGFAFNGIHSNKFGIIMRSRNRPLLPNLRKRELIVPGRHGVYDFEGNKYDNKIIEVECFIDKKNLNDLRQHMRLISGWLKNKGQLRFDDEPDKYMIGRVYSSVPFEQIAGHGTFTLVFDCEPFAYSDTNMIEITKEDDSPLFVFNNGNIETPHEITITNTGTSTINGFTIKIIKNQ